MNKSAPEDKGVVNLPSRHSVEETISRLQRLLATKGIKVFARIDQSKEAASVGLYLRPMQLLIFGDPRAGTPLMEVYPSLAIDLPLKALAWEDAAGKVWLSYNNFHYLQQRHALPDEPFRLTVMLLETAVGDREIR
jgi:uncharacterized protein (DUF302 family)